MEMDTRIKVWKVKRDIENDTKKKDAKRSKREKAKQDRVKYYLHCGCLKKKGPTKEEIELKRLKNRSKSIKSYKTWDDNYQGFQGEPASYTSKYKESEKSKAIQRWVCVVVFLGGLYNILNSSKPGIFEDSLKEINDVLSFLLETAFNVFITFGLFILSVPDILMHFLSGTSHAE